ncbi:MAG: acyltransferase [Spirochaetota bacterium]
MKGTPRIERHRYTPVAYTAFNETGALKALMAAAGVLVLPLVLPLVLLARLSPKVGFRTASELLSLVPYGLGETVRYAFYRRALEGCGKKVYIGFGTVFYYPQVRIGDNVMIGMHNTVHHCDFGSNVMTAEGCRFLSGSHYHRFDRTDIPMNRQGGELKRIQVGDDVWIGANCVVMEEIGKGAVVGAGSVVTRPVEPCSICAGNPARLLRRRACMPDPAPPGTGEPEEGSAAPAAEKETVW